LYDFLPGNQNVYELHKYDVTLWEHLLVFYKIQNELFEKITIAHAVRVSACTTKSYKNYNHITKLFHPLLLFLI